MDQAAQLKQAVAEALAAHQSWLGISGETWAIVFATFAGPIVAIVASMLLTARSERRSNLKNRRFYIFRTLLATRRTAINQEHVAAVNLIEIDFYGVEPVMRAWRRYMDHLAPPSDRELQAHELAAFEDIRTDLLAKLLDQLGRELGFEIGEIDLKRGGYAPKGWKYRDDAEIRMREAAIAFYEGHVPLRIQPQEPPAAGTTLLTSLPPAR